MRTKATVCVGIFALLVMSWCPEVGAVPPAWKAPKVWLVQALCVHSREGAWNAATGNGYEGGMQFLKSTWTRVGGRVGRQGHWASTASPREQLFRAWLVWRQDGGSWREWGTAGACGLR